jgi:carboxyl-terminal processing protease
MNEILKFMKTTKGLVLIAVLLTAGLFFAFTKNNGGDKPISQQQKLLTTVGELLSKQHYSPQDIDDNFSKKLSEFFWCWKLCKFDSMWVDV